ncbi:MAG: argininosuccinate lyase, partial [Myxococcales bacterium]|nr:argininosuccinate lyase [Myxococcales bacterium]
PFREAHHVAGRIVAACEADGTDLSSLTAESLQGFHPAFDALSLGVLDPRQAALRRRSFGGTAPAEVARQVKALREWLAAG